MRALDHLSSMLLGIIQGLTEFLPVSSSGHLAMTQRWLDLPPNAPSMLLFNVLAHVGTLAAVGIVFAAPLRRYLARLLAELNSTWSGGPRVACRVAALTACATVPTAIIGLTFKDTIEQAFDRPVWIGGALLVTGTLLALTACTGRARRGWKQFSWWRAALVGLAQGAAILPGLSRSGATICIASYLGLRRRWAAEFSFLIAVPAILGATLLKVRETFALPASDLASVPWGPILTGSVISFVVGIAALKLLLAAVRRGKLHYFAAYCWALGLFVLVSGG